MTTSSSLPSMSEIFPAIHLWTELVSILLGTSRDWISTLFQHLDIDLLHINFLAEFGREFGRLEQLSIYTWSHAGSVRCEAPYWWDWCREGQCALADLRIGPASRIDLRTALFTTMYICKLWLLQKHEIPLNKQLIMRSMPYILSSDCLVSIRL